MGLENNDWVLEKRRAICIGINANSPQAEAFLKTLNIQGCPKTYVCRGNQDVNQPVSASIHDQPSRRIVVAQGIMKIQPSPHIASTEPVTPTVSEDDEPNVEVATVMNHIGCPICEAHDAIEKSFIRSHTEKVQIVTTALQKLQQELPLTAMEYETLITEGSYRLYKVLEAMLPRDHPLVIHFAQKWAIKDILL